ncbi:hypothetical protein HYX16_00770 [Candidatus Woesearchaeota archaeon]|nr:hypothetical protein [Candidatus Woesearchaeota archaeon]
MSKIIVDHRESKNIIKELAKHNEIEIKQLSTADFIIQGITTEGKELVVGIERKTKEDFLSSIIDKRIIIQLNLLRENFEHPILIIEGTDNFYNIRNFHPNAIRGMLASIAIDYKIPILNTMNFRDTASLISIISKRLEKPKKVFSLLKKRKPLTIKEQQELIISTLPGVGIETSKELLKKFQSVKNIINSDEKELKQVDNIGKKKSAQIFTLLRYNYEAVHKDQNDQNLQDP